MRLPGVLAAMLAWALFPAAGMAQPAAGGGEAGALPAAAAVTHVRAVTPLARDLLLDGLGHSPTFRALVGDLASTDLTVLIHTGRWTLAEGPCHASLRLMAARPGLRYVRVWVDPWWKSRPDQLVLLAHELQHAAELGRAPEVLDRAAAASLFRRIGFAGEAGYYDTAAARRVELSVAAELVRSGRW